MVIRSCSSFLRGLLISRAAWRRQYPLFLALRPPVPPPCIPPPPTRFFSSSRRSTKRSAAKTPMDSAAAGEPFYVVRKGDVIGIYKTLSECQAQVSNSVSTFDFRQFLFLATNACLLTMPLPLLLLLGLRPFRHCLQRLLSAQRHRGISRCARVKERPLRH
jgi:hypothetical protein